MIETHFGETPYSTQDAADALGCSVHKTTLRVQRVTERLVCVVLAEPERWAASGRPDRVAGAVEGFVRAAGRLAESDPQKFRGWLRELLNAD